MVSGFSDQSLQARKAEADLILNHPSVCHWFAVNANISHSKLTPLPIGFNYHEMNPAFGKRNAHIDEPEWPLQFENFLKQNLEKMNQVDKVDKIYSNSHLNLNGNRSRDYVEIKKNNSITSKIYFQEEFLPRKVLFP